MAKKSFLEQKNAKLVVILAVALIAMGYVAYTGSFGEKTISASGTATDSVMADQVEIHIGASTQRDTAEAAQTENARIVDAMIAALKAKGLTNDDIRTSYYYVNPVYNWTDGTSKIVGYEALYMLLVRTDKIESAGSYIDAAVGAGANRIDGVYFGLKPKTENSLRTSLLGDAAQNAKAKAEAIAAGLGLRVTGVKSIVQSDFYYPPLYREIAVSDVSAAGGAENVKSQLIPGKVDITATVSAEFSVQ